MKPIIASRVTIEKRLKECSDSAVLDQIIADYQQLPKPTNADFNKLEKSQRGWLGRLEKEIPRTIKEMLAQFAIEKANLAQLNALVDSQALDATTAAENDDFSDTEESDDVYTGEPFGAKSSTDFVKPADAASTTDTAMPADAASATDTAMPATAANTTDTAKPADAASATDTTKPADATSTVEVTKPVDAASSADMTHNANAPTLVPQSGLPVRTPAQEARAQELQKVAIKLDLLAAKIKRFATLNDPANEKVLEALEKVHSEISVHINNFIEGTINRKQFKQSAEQIFNDETPEMIEIATHRGWKQAIVNFATAVAGVFAIYAIAAAAKGSWTLFAVETDSAEKAHQLRDEIVALTDEVQNASDQQNATI